MAHQQTTLLLSRDERLAALRRIDAAGVGCTPRQWANVAELLRQIEFTTFADGCTAYAETLAARFFDGAGVSRATFFRVVGLAATLGLVTVENRWTRRPDGTARSQQANAWRVEWARVAALAGPPAQSLAGHASEAVSARPATPRPRLRPTETHKDLPSRPQGVRSGEGGESFSSRKVETPPCQIETPPSQNAPLEGIDLSYDLLSTVDRRPASHAIRDGGPRRPPTVDRRPTTDNRRRTTDDPTLPTLRLAELPQDAERIARECFRKLSRLGLRVASPLDGSLVVKAAWVACTSLPEAWLWDAIAGLDVCCERPSWRYLHATLRNNAAERYGFDFDAALRRLRLRPETIRSLCRSDADERLCASGQGPP